VFEVDESNLGATYSTVFDTDVAAVDQLTLSLSVDLLKFTEWGETYVYGFCLWLARVWLCQ
jgi:hypothetical protein